MRLTLFSNSLAAGLIFLASSSPLFSFQAGQERQEQSFQAVPGDTIIVQNDYGRIRVTGSAVDEVQVSIRQIAADNERLKNIVVLAQKVKSHIFLNVFYYDYQSESVYIDIQTPPFVNLAVWGANSAVEISNLEGSAHVYTQTGLITAEELGSSASLTTETGNIMLRSRRQPEGDIRLESTEGEVSCELSPELNVRGWLRAGSRLSWNAEVEFDGGQLERQIGIGGPLLLASSKQGSVRVALNLKPLTAQADALSKEPPSDPVSIRLPQGEQRTPPRDAGTRPPDLTREPPSPADESPSYPAASGPGPDAGEFSVRVDVNWIYLNVSVRDRYTNRSIPHLTRDDFLVYEDSQLQQIEQFQSTDAPFSVLLLLDVSGSTEGYLEDVKRASIEFLQKMRSDDRIAIAAFNSEVRLLHSFSSDRGRLERQVRQIRSGGGTAFYDALDISVTDYMYGEEGRKAIVVFTDGVDGQIINQPQSGSRIPFQQLYRSIEEADSIIYTIFLDTEHRGRSRQSRRAYETAYTQMKKIADQTGGRFYGPNSIYDVRKMFQEIADDLRIQYLLAYSSTNPLRDGSWRKVQVRIKDNRNWVARTRQGYYAPRS